MNSQLVDQLLELRERAALLDSEVASERAEHFPETSGMLREAADEIERLQTALDAHRLSECCMFTAKEEIEGGQHVE